jgi:hypothetical protein
MQHPLPRLGDWVIDAFEDEYPASLAHRVEHEVL